MVTEFKLPDIGEGIAEAEIVEWLVSEGDFVNAYQTIVRVETDKTIADLPSPATGTLLKINFKKGDKVNVGSVLCIIGENGEKIKSVVKEKRVESIKRNVENKIIIPDGKVLASPSVRKVAYERGIDLSLIKGSGDGGQILMYDIDKNGLMDLNQVLASITSKTKAVIPVHIAGNMVNMDILREFLLRE